MTVCIQGLHKWIVLTLEMGNICMGPLSLLKHVLGLLLFRKEAICMCKENAYVLCWAWLEETLFKEETKNIREILSAESFLALFLCLK